VSDEKIARLVTPLPLEAEIRDGILKLVRDVMADAEAGTLATLLVICERQDGAWSREWSGTRNMRAAIGELEIVKQEWIAEYSKNYGAPTS
jgi:hypothetical protein